jgi:peptide/nickel transport system substrate-binding protein
MENRFGVKDFILFLLLTVLIGAVLLAMRQYDRQWSDIQAIRDRLDDQSRDLRDLQRTLARGVNVAGGAGVSTTGPDTSAASYPSTDPAFYGKDDPFARQKAARAMEGFAEGDWVVDTSMGQIAKLTPFVSTDLYAMRIQELVLETLAGRDVMTLEWGPGLASSWKSEDNVAAYDKYVEEQTKKGRTPEEIKKDPNLPVPLTITFTLRDGARFSDGYPITPDDFVFTFNWIMNEAVAAPRDRSYFEKIKSVEKKGGNQIVFKFREPYFDAMGLASSLFALPKHFYEKFKPEEYNQSAGLLMGSGPYRLESPTAWRPGSGQVVLVRNERYWGVPPSFDRIIYKEISNDVARQTSYRNGEIDVLEARPEQFDAMIKEQAVMKRSQAVNVLSLNGGYRFVAWQQKKDGKPTIFADRRVRRAMAMLVDRKRLLQEVMLGYGVLATGPYSPAGKQADKNLELIPYDVEGAKKLLAEADCKDVGTGILQKPDGKPFRFTLTYPSGSPNYEKMVLFLKDAYARAGIALDPNPLEWAVFSDKLKNKDFEAVSLGWGGGNPESDIYQMFDSSQSLEEGDNFMWYKNPEVDALIRQVRVTIDDAKRVPLYHKIQKLIYEDQPYMFLWFQKELFLVDSRIHNVQGGPLGLPSSVRTEWYVPRKQQKWIK